MISSVKPASDAHFYGARAEDGQEPSPHRHPGSRDRQRRRAMSQDHASRQSADRRRRDHSPRVPGPPHRDGRPGRQRVLHRLTGHLTPAATRTRRPATRPPGPRFQTGQTVSKRLVQRSRRVRVCSRCRRGGRRCRAQLCGVRSFSAPVELITRGARGGRCAALVRAQTGHSDRRQHPLVPTSGRLVPGMLDQDDLIRRCPPMPADARRRPGRDDCRAGLAVAGRRRSAVSPALSR